MEYGLIALVVTDAHLLDHIGKDLMRIRWMDQAAESMADALVALDHDASAAQALASVQRACPDASTLLAQAMIETEDSTEKLFQARLMAFEMRRHACVRKVGFHPRNSTSSSSGPCRCKRNSSDCEATRLTI